VSDQQSGQAWLQACESEVPCLTTFVDGRQARGRQVLEAFRPFFEDARIKKVWHNYSFDRHVLKRMGVWPGGFAGDTMHMARLWDSSRKGKGYSLEDLSRCRPPARHLLVFCF